jgi:hypothetical protein
MKQFVKITFSLFVALLSFANLQAQDVIHRKNGKTLEVKVLEINADDVKYKLFTQPDGITYAMDVTLIKKIVFANGTVQKFEHDANFDNKEYYEGQNKSAYKISFLGPILGYTTLTYERNLKPGRSAEGRLGIIGLGKNINDQKGAYGSFGYKFYSTPDYYTSRQRYGHLLKGAYIRPEINIGHYTSLEQTFSILSGSTTTPQKRSTTYGSVMICAGKQWIFDNKFALDFFSGIGMGFLDRTKSNNNENFNLDLSSYGNYVGKSGLAFNIGFNVGILGK